jgi:hypothetical protein
VDDSALVGNRDAFSGANPTAVRLLPFLPVGNDVFTRLPARTVVLKALPAEVSNGVIVAEDSTSAGLLAVRDGQVVGSLCLENSMAVFGVDVFARIASWHDALISATRLGTDELKLVEQQLAADVCYDDLRLEWIDWAVLLADIRSRPGCHVVVLDTPSGSGAITISGVSDGRTYIRPASTTIEVSGFDDLACEASGVVRVFRLPRDTATNTMPQPTPAYDIPAATEASVGIPRQRRDGDTMAGSPQEGSALTQIFGVPDSVIPTANVHHSEGAPADASPNVRQLLPDLKLLVRSRLLLSSGRLDALLDEAVAAGRPVESVAGDVRNLSIRGVMQATLNQLANDIVAMSVSRTR